MGIAPIIFLASDLKRSGIHLKIIYGTKTKSELTYIDELKTYSENILFVTEDGSYGKRGMVTDFINEKLKRDNGIKYDALKLYACGPITMLKVICKLSNQLSLDCEVSLEENMACGFGACMGCVTNTLTGYKRVCTDGPVFKSSELIFD